MVSKGGDILWGMHGMFTSTIKAAVALKVVSIRTAPDSNAHLCTRPVQWLVCRRGAWSRLPYKLQASSCGILDTCRICMRLPPYETSRKPIADEHCSFRFKLKLRRQRFRQLRLVDRSRPFRAHFTAYTLICAWAAPRLVRPVALRRNDAV